MSIEQTEKSAEKSKVSEGSSINLNSLTEGSSGAFDKMKSDSFDSKKLGFPELSISGGTFDPNKVPKDGGPKENWKPEGGKDGGPKDNWKPEGGKDGGPKDNWKPEGGKDGGLKKPESRKEDGKNGGLKDKPDVDPSEKKGGKNGGEKDAAGSVDDKTDGSKDGDKKAGVNKEEKANALDKEAIANKEEKANVLDKEAILNKEEKANMMKKDAVRAAQKKEKAGDDEPMDKALWLKKMRQLKM